MLLDTAPDAESGTQFTQLTHRVIDDLSRSRHRADPIDIVKACRRVVAIHEPHRRGALVQNLAAHVGSYYRQLHPPAGFVFGGHDLNVGFGPSPLMWRRKATREVLVDVLHTDSVWLLDTAASRTRIQHHLLASRDQFGAALLGVRVLTTGYPPASRLALPEQQLTALIDTPYLTKEQNTHG
jgi:hypothetical protein